MRNHSNSHGRDNIIHFHAPLDRASGLDSSTIENKNADIRPKPSHSQAVKSDAALTNLLQPPKIIRSLPVNSLNFCGFHLIPIPVGYELQPRHTETPYDDAPSISQDDHADAAVRTASSDINQKWSRAQGLLAVPNLTNSETVSDRRRRLRPRLFKAFRLNPSSSR